MHLHFWKKYNEKPLYKYEPWSITENQFKVETNHKNETIFSLGNGYMGMRGTLEEDYSGPENTTTPGMYINGFYNSEEIVYGEKTPNLPAWGQTIVNIAKWSSINLYIDNEKFDILNGELRNYRRILDMKQGVLRREFVWISPGGKKIYFDIQRFLSQSSIHLGIIQYKFKPLNFTGSVKLVTELQSDSKNYHHLRNKTPLSIEEMDFENKTEFLIQKSKNPLLYVALAVKDTFIKNSKSIKDSRKFRVESSLVSEYDLKVKKGNIYSLNRFLSIYTSLDLEEVQANIGKRLKKRVIDEVNRAVKKGSEKIFFEHCDYIREFWEDVDVKIYGDISLQQAFRFNAFQLLQSTGRNGRTNVAAKGLSGEFYEGHYFWDTETYIIPFFLFSKPEVARSLLMYRYNNLDKARKNARRVRLKGALFPWRTINGEEASGFFMGSTVQYHINADIAYAIYQYITVTGDKEFLYKYGAEILIETARMWVNLGGFIPFKENKFCINEVCGPDEYKPGVNNNCYTNYMAKFNLDFAINVVDELKKEKPDLYIKLTEKVKLKEDEITQWEKAAREMYLPYDKKRGIHPQDDSFLYKEAIDIESIPVEEIPLVSNWHPLVIWRYQIIKQADVVLLMLLLGEHFSLEEKKANYDFYEPKTTHDSSLSPAIYSIIANEIGYQNDAYKYFMLTARLDLDDYNKNTYQGIHTACMAGSWLALIQGFAGMRNYGGSLYFSPTCPEKWEGFEFIIKFQGRQIKIIIRFEKTRYKLINGEEIEIFHRKKAVLLKPGIIEVLNNF